MQKEIKLGLREGEVKLVPYQESWEEDFQKEKENLKSYNIFLKIEHCGSTSIKDIYSKPIMNICVQVENFDDLDLVKDKMSDLGYSYSENNNFGDHELFKKNKDDVCTHHVHVMTKDGENWQKAIKFRNYLQDNSEVAQEYEKLKLDLADKFPNNRKSYGEEKNEFINLILSHI